MDVAGQLDWTFIDDSSAGRLKQACIDAFTSGRTTGGYRIPTADWLSLVSATIAESGGRVTFGTYLAGHIPAGETSLIPSLLELSQNPATRDWTLAGLKAVDPALDDERVLAQFRKSLDEAKQSPDTLAARVGAFVYTDGTTDSSGMLISKLRFVPELEELLVSPFEEVQRSARDAFRAIRSGDDRVVVKNLLQIVDDPSNPNRVHAIRALAAIGPPALSAEDKLRNIAHSDSDPDRYAAAVALERIAGKENNRSYEFLLGVNPQSTDVGPHERRLEEEQRELFPNGIYPPMDLRLGGGGGVF